MSRYHFLLLLSSKYCHEEQLPYDVVLFSDLPHFCSLVCIQYNARKRKGSEKCGRPRNTYHMNDVWWMRGGCRGDIAHLQTHVINNRASEVEYYRSCEHLGSWLSLEHSMKSSTLFECGSLLRPPHIHQMSFMCVPRPSPFFTTLPLPYIILNANRRKKRRRPGNDTIHAVMTLLLSIFLERCQCDRSCYSYGASMSKPHTIVS